ncbi:MAG: nicotinate-nucleotide--dimethylbenzimidazole phosphoribosyltransferase [Lachnospiraceae bacterium]|nr:nicotinate-nucleotide--dimethylbenzimidazole phosphoribosyltransferase [Lachnospiraceae bacterium]
MTLEEVLQQIEPVDRAAMAQAEKRWDAIAKPLKSLGRLEETVIRMAGMSRGSRVKMDKKALVAMCADNGVLAEGVAQSTAEVTAIIANQFANGQTATTVMCDCAGVDLFPVDIGILAPICEEYDVVGDGEAVGKRIDEQVTVVVDQAIVKENDGAVSGETLEPRKLLNCCIMRGTGNIAVGPAMSREQAEVAIMVGVDIAQRLCRQGYDLIATGEMGIGNTTTSSAMTAVLLERPVELVTGKGSGLSSAGMERKINAIKRAIAVNQPDPEDAIDVLAKVGGLDIAGMVGLFIGGALCRIPVMVDGLISSVAALTAIRICPTVRDYVITTHTSKEPAGRMLLEAIRVPAILDACMSLGEGSGAIAAIPVFEMGVKVFNQMGTFDDIDMEAYTPQM